MSTPLEVELKSYAHNKVGVHLKYEYDRQIDIKWKPHINLMVDAQTTALNRQQKVLNDVRAQIEKERQAAFGLSMLALTLVGGPVLSWISGKIQYNWFPRYAPSGQLKGREVYLIKKDKLFGKGYDLFETDHNKVHAKIFGDLGAQVAGLGIDKALKVVTPDSNRAKNAIQGAASSAQSSFKTNLENALAAEASLTSDAIMSLANSINENVNYGAESLQKLRRLNARARDSKVSEKELEVMAKKMITDDIDRQRQKWANEWFYYGYDPGTTMGMAESIEREVWALWILNEQLEIKTEFVPSEFNVSDREFAWGATFEERGVPEPVLRRLANFGVVEARTQLQKLTATAAQGVKTQQGAARAARIRKEDEEAAAAYREAMKNAEGAEDPARERANVTRQKYEADKKVQERRAQERRDQPPISVGSTVGTHEEIDALESWAKCHPPTLISGSMMHSKRTIGSIDNIYAKP